MNVDDLVYNLLDPIGYCYELSDCELIIEMIIKRIKREDFDREYEEIVFRLASIIFQQLVMFLGDYGINPWCGWIEDEYKEEVIADLIKWLENEKRAEELNK